MKTIRIYGSGKISSYEFWSPIERPVFIYFNSNYDFSPLEPIIETRKFSIAKRCQGFGVNIKLEWAIV